ncbi:MAG: hypothetical protein GF384_07385 [Elusimicrobia bacterium]|nr:hypothetical protein [Elusimicrobiota bacterium]MBD3412479.1 hypothetical protein [Elusimicrobiota bacterium]
MSRKSRRIWCAVPVITLLMLSYVSGAGADNNGGDMAETKILFGKTITRAEFEEAKSFIQMMQGFGEPDTGDQKWKTMPEYDLRPPLKTCSQASFDADVKKLTFTMRKFVDSVEIESDISTITNAPYVSGTYQWNSFKDSGGNQLPLKDDTALSENNPDVDDKNMLSVRYALKKDFDQWDSIESWDINGKLTLKVPGSHEVIEFTKTDAGKQKKDFTLISIKDNIIQLESPRSIGSIYIAAYDKNNRKLKQKTYSRSRLSEKTVFLKNWEELPDEVIKDPDAPYEYRLSLAGEVDQVRIFDVTSNCSTTINVKPVAKK